ncbi:MAG: tRNA pseudouridine(13) synthase TruD [Candidatus Aenigmarchaeota archaeon]|nr:tRNA pseudouridine(13) synthase TruD [Candidatus Aenigmarchaeota archaeon]
MKYFTKTLGISGRLRQRIEDFKVEEIPIDLPEGDEYTIFWMEKFNSDTNRALKVISDNLHVGVKRLSVAGTKDKRAVTRQRVSAWKIPAEELERINLKYIKVSDFSYSSGRLKLGDSKGNAFVIIIRDLDIEKKELEKRIKSLIDEMKDGVPNYFGVQRFGEVRPITHLVGKAMLKGDFEEAIKIYIANVYPKEPDDAKEARTFLTENWNHDGFKKGLKMFPMRLRYERNVLDYLVKHPVDFVGALRRFPRNIMKMFVNAYQSYIFNEVVQSYIEKGLKTVPLIGFDTTLGKNDQLIKELLKREEIKLEYFILKSMPELSCTGSERKTLLNVKDLKLIEIGEDEFNEGKLYAKISFALPPGSYATVILKEMMKD